jgi:hypothetical protein
LHWSIPVSMGYGRRLRFLVLDRAHGDKLIGLIGLADPVFALAARDRWIGWDVETRTRALTNVMDAFVLGAVPPYSTLRAGKMVALLATSGVVRDTFRIRYAHRTTLISDWPTVPSATPLEPATSTSPARSMQIWRASSRNTEAKAKSTPTSGGESSRARATREKSCTVR